MTKCKQCKQPYTKQRPMQTCCSIACSVELVRGNAAKKAKAEANKDRKETRAKLEAMEGLPELKSKAQAAFNAYIRARDYGKPCICCGKPIAWGTASTGGVCDAGHFRGVGSAPHLRFNEDNVHAQRKYCNDFRAGNHANYRIGLIERIGLQRVEILEADQCIRKYTRDGLKELATQYRVMTRELEKQRSEA